MVLTGDIGTGKTTTVRALLEKIHEDTSSALILDPLLEEEDFIKAVLEDFGIDLPDHSEVTRKELINRLNQFLLGEHIQGRKTILIIDEAQHLSDQALEEIRLLSNLETEKAKLLQIILVGQVELHQKLKSSLLRPLNQRISIRYHLSPLSRVDIDKYIHHRLSVVGHNGHITFSAGALNEIFKHSRGIPRLINLICDRTLLAGYARQTYYLDKRTVKKGTQSLKKQGVSYTTPPKTKRLIFLGVLALFLGCAFLIGPRGEALYVKFAKFTHSLRKPVHNRLPGKQALPVTEESSAPPPAGGIGSTSTSINESTPLAGVTNQTYGIQISSNQDNSEALMDVNQLQKLGYRDFTIVKTKIPGKGIWYRVLFGKFRTRDEAQTMLNKIKTIKAFSDSRIIKYK